MKILNVILLGATLSLFTSCAHHRANHDCCHGKNHECQQGSCKLDKSCCNDECKKCDGKDSCKSGSCEDSKKV